MNDYEWTDQFARLYKLSVSKYAGGNYRADTYFEKPDLDFLSGIGCRPAELYDFAEDAPELSFETALLITAARRDYFLTVQRGRWSDTVLGVGEFPAKYDAIAGIEWLPRIILKARAKLRGEMPAELMYCCGGDRAFLRRHQIHPADFLRLVWTAGKDEAQIVEFVKTQ